MFRKDMLGGIANPLRMSRGRYPKVGTSVKPSATFSDFGDGLDAAS